MECYKPYNHTIVRPFKGDELMRDDNCKILI